ncbi:MAG: T9SS C-terminal target domain-containing protein [Bacteroidetes bacterium]|nr:MAG: T9SS C-terminal target domain-containing protein [Bacteroidota bacterium]
MRIVTTGRWLCLALLLAGLAGNAHAQSRQVTLRLNTATIPDTITTDSFIEVRGAVKGISPVTLYDGNIIDWNASSTLEPANVGGDYWEVSFEIADTTDLTFKFYSQQAEDIGLNGWEADPNPNIPPGSNDTTLTVHFFEVQGAFKDFPPGNKGDYDWRPYEPKEDTVAVWFRVYMNTEEGQNDGYNRASSIVGVRGDPLDPDGDGPEPARGPLDWGMTKVMLTPELDDVSKAGYHLYSGVAYYPADLAGTEQAYKFFVEPDGWEEGNVSGNRTFTVPAQDTTLHWVYYGNTAPLGSAQPVQSAIIFAVDLSPMEAIGVFDRARGDTLEVRGDFNGWDCAGDGAPDDCLLDPVPGQNIYELVVPITAIPGATRNYKFFLNLDDEKFKQQFGVEYVPSGWEEPISTQGANRTFVFEGIADGFQDLGVFNFNDVLPENIIPAGTSIDLTFSVDMSAALANEARPFNPDEDTVTVEIGDPIWAFTQGFVVEGGGAVKLTDVLQLTDDDADGVYSGTYTVVGPTYSGIQYKYAYGNRIDGTEDFVVEAGGTTSGSGRRRTRFIVPNADGSWPSAWAFNDAGETEVYQPEGPLPFEGNPAAATSIEPVDGELPTQIALTQNYPNPFNPTTSFEYTLDATTEVTVRVFDLLGRQVATLVDGMQQAGSYRVTFDASHLASGMYIYQLETPTRVLSKRMILLK